MQQGVQNDMVVADRGTWARSEVPVEETWDLSAIYPDMQSWEADLKKIREDVPALVALRGTLDQGADRLLKALQLEEAIGERLSRAFSYAGLKKDEDNTDTQAQANYDRVVVLSVSAISPLWTSSSSSSAVAASSPASRLVPRSAVVRVAGSDMLTGF